MCKKEEEIAYSCSVSGFIKRGEVPYEKKYNQVQRVRTQGHKHESVEADTDRKWLINLEMVLPVRIDWSTLRVVDLIEDSRMSAGTLSPTVDRKNKAQETLSYLFTN